MSSTSNGFSFASLWRDALEEFGSPDRGFWLTVRCLLTAPGQTLRRVFDGEETRLTRPIRFFTVIYSVYALVYLSTGAMDEMAAQTTADMVANVQASLQSNPATANLSVETINALNPLIYWVQYPLAYELLVVAALWLASWPALARMGLNGGERLACTLYLYGVLNLLQIPLFWVAFTDYGRLVHLGFAVLLIAYMAWATHGLMQPHRRLGFLRGLGWWLVLQLLVGSVMIGATIKIGYDAARAEQARQAAEAPVILSEPADDTE